MPPRGWPGPSDVRRLRRRGRSRSIARVEGSIGSMVMTSSLMRGITFSTASKVSRSFETSKSRGSVELLKPMADDEW